MEKQKSGACPLDCQGCESGSPDAQGCQTAPKLPAEHPVDVYLFKLRRFIVENNIPRDLPSRVRKAGEELGELAEAAIRGDWDEIREEAADFVTVGLDILLITDEGATYSEAATRAIPFLLLNIEEKAEKYRQGRNRTEERR